MSRIRIRGFQSVDKLYLIWGKGLYENMRVELKGNNDDGSLRSGPFVGKNMIVSADSRRATVTFDEVPEKTDKEELDELAELEVTVYGENNESDSETSAP